MGVRLSPCSSSRTIMARGAAALMVLCAGLLLCVAPAAAQAWPAKPMRIVVPWPPGGSADVLGRLAADHLGKVFGQTVVVENRPGASGMIGSAMVARAEPDGYTFVVSGIPSHVIAPATAASAGYDPLASFTHVAYFGGSPIAIVAHATLGVKTLEELVALARDGRVEYISPGVGSLGNLVGEFLARKRGVKLTHIPYKGGAQAATDLIAGHVKAGFMTWTTLANHIRAGTLVPLAVSSARRLPDFPDVPTLKELGYPDMVTTTWWAFSGPAGLPAEIVQPLNRELGAYLDSAAVRGKLAQDSIETETMSPEEFTAFVAAEIRKWTPIAKAAMQGEEPKR